MNIPYSFRMITQVRWNIVLYTPWEGYMLVGYDVTTDACSYWGMHQWPHLSKSHCQE